MIAVDTNVLVRMIAQDDPAQLAQARRLLATSACFLPDSVLLETAWVLRSSYGGTRAQIHAELTTVLGLPNVRVADPERLHLALQWYSEGLDFADALHLASAQQATAFATFDRAFIRRAADKGSCPVCAPADLSTSEEPGEAPG